MRVVGEWLVCQDGVTRPAVQAVASGIDGNRHIEYFLIDSCADSTVLSAVLLGKLQLPAQPPPPDLSLQGISGNSPFVVVSISLELTRDDGNPAYIRGTFAAFTDPHSSDLSILGRDVLNNFDLILSWRRKQVLLLAGNHDYQVLSS
jgi:hypothetical protein